MLGVPTERCAHSTITFSWPRVKRRDAMPARRLASSTGQSVKTTESGGLRGFDAAKLVKGRKRHIITDTGGLLVGAMVHAADIQDRDGAPALLASIRSAFPRLRHVFADGGYAGPKQTPRQGLRENHRMRRSLAPKRQHPAPQPQDRKILNSMNSFRARLYSRDIMMNCLSHRKTCRFPCGKIVGELWNISVVFHRPWHCHRLYTGRIGQNLIYQA